MRKSHKVIAGIAIVGALTTAIALKPTHIGPSDIYPTIQGVTNPNVTQDNINQTICVSGWTATIRPPATYTTGLKIKQMQALGLAGATLAYEEDHFISLELGGNPTDPNNLWPEPYNASISGGGAKIKDSVENFLKKEVCNGSITLAEAQNEITSDWYKVYKSMPSQSATFGSVVSDPDDE